MSVPYSIYITKSVLYRNKNVNTGHGVDFATDESLAVQTAAVDFVIINQTVSSLSTLLCIKSSVTKYT